MEPVGPAGPRSVTSLSGEAGDVFYRRSRADFGGGTGTDRALGAFGRLDQFEPPLDPLKITVEAPSAAVEDAVRVTDCPPVVIEKGAAGDKVTPLGRPVTETSIPWLNPFMAFTERFSVALCPAPMDWFCGLTPIEKLGDGAGPIPDELEPPPQDAKRSASSDPARGTIRPRNHPHRRFKLPMFLLPSNQSEIEEPSN